MNYPWTEKQTLIQWLLNTFDPRMWGMAKFAKTRGFECECSWQVFQGKLMWIPLGGCPYHD